MSVFKCKMCGGTIEFESGATVGVCDSCGTKQTLPRLDNNEKENLYDRANHFRRNNEYDKAMSIYERILNEDAEDGETYWSLILCRYGIEYVEDPETHLRVPTVNRAQYTSIYDDEDYKSAIKYADASQKEIYEAEAAAINEIQKEILDISLKEEPFDVFICYKDTDGDGRRTRDSVLANELYHLLTEDGFKVFFSRITLEDKLGTEYEPYIFAALNSAKVMVVIGTRPEYFNAVWVKNEWSRFLALIQNGAKKIMIPAYRDMDPYDLPEEFSHLQAQDMSKLGFMQDLVRGIKKITVGSGTMPGAKGESAAADSRSATGPNPLLTRAFLYLEDEDWENADIYCERALDQEPTNAEAYLCKLLISLRLRNRKQLSECWISFEDNKNYEKVIRFGDDQLKTEMQDSLECIRRRQEEEKLRSVYQSAESMMQAAVTVEDFDSAAELFQSIGEFEDAAQKAEDCKQNALMLRQHPIYTSALRDQALDTIDSLTLAIEHFDQVKGYMDAEERSAACSARLSQLQQWKAEQAEDYRKAAKIAVPTFILIIAVVSFYALFTQVLIPNSQYQEAMALFEAGHYEKASAAFGEILYYKDAGKYFDKCCLTTAETYFAEGKYENTVAAYEKIRQYNKTAKMYQEACYQCGLSNLESGHGVEAVEFFKKAGKYKDAPEKISEYYYQCGLSNLESGHGVEAVGNFKKAGKYRDAPEKISEYYYQCGLSNLKNGDEKSAVANFKKAGDYKNSPQMVLQAKYEYVNKNRGHGIKYRFMNQYLRDLKKVNYKNSSAIYNELCAWHVDAFFSLSNDAIHKASISKYDPVYCHYQLSGGPVDGKIIVRFQISFPSGQTDSGDSECPMTDGDAHCFYFKDGIYQYPQYGTTGTLTVRFFDEDQNLIGKASVLITM